jgi:hypothetical protein
VNQGRQQLIIAVTVTTIVDGRVVDSTKMVVGGMWRWMLLRDLPEMLILGGRGSCRERGKRGSGNKGKGIENREGGIEKTGRMGEREREQREREQRQQRGREEKIWILLGRCEFKAGIRRERTE